MIHEVFCYLRPRNAEAAIAFYKAAFGATERFRLTEPGTGRIGHAELQLGPTVLMLSDEFPGFQAQPPDQPAHFAIHLHVDDADALIAQAAGAGAEITRPPSDEFYGERSGRIQDPFGYSWIIGHSIEQLDPAEMQRRYNALMGDES